MPHYSNGRLAKIGDLVKGRGYNVKDEHGQLKELVGIVVGIVQSESCNLRLAHNFRKVLLSEAADEASRGDISAIMVEGCRISVGGSFTQGKHDAIAIYNSSGTALLFDVEYGQCDHFVLVVEIEESPGRDPASEYLTHRT